MIHAIREIDLGYLPMKKKKQAEILVGLLEKILEEDVASIRNPGDVFVLSADLVLLEKEHFVVFFLNTKNRMIGKETVSIGSLNASIVHPREVFRPAIQRSSASIICVHNHPSGDPMPSPEDIETTQRLYEAGKIIGIELLDHVIVAREGYVSLKERGYI